MSSFAEFIIVAVMLYLWESMLWLPLGNVALRRRWFANRWRPLDPRAIFATRTIGLVPLLPIPPDAGFAPCQPPPLLASDDDAILIEPADGRPRRLANLSWEMIDHDPHHLKVAGERVRISSPRCRDVLRHAKRRGLTPPDAARLAWRLALSPGNAGREWRRWMLVSAPLRWYGPVLTIGFLAGLPLVYVMRGAFPAACFALWLWLVMGFVAGHLWWLGRRVYPGVRSALRMDAVLALLVPFHAMRAYEIASLHAMATTHPVGLILWAKDVTNPWLAAWIRRCLHPLPDLPEDALACAARVRLLDRALTGLGMVSGDFDKPPDVTGDETAERYCPRCHGLFRRDVACCPDCHGLALRKLR